MRSQQFDDIYFSAEDGLAETRHTFLAGNNLPQAWAGRQRFCICETGFGTGLNMIAAWKLFEETADPDARLDLISIEKYPLSRAEIAQALAGWDLQPYLGRMVAAYPLRIPGFHRINLSARVTLTLIFEDVHDALPQVEASVDAWFLDGFAPAKNPDMWTQDLYAHMARLSAPGASAATFTAAGAVRRGLAAAGFAVEKRPGYGRKRDMVVGAYTGFAHGRPTSPIRKSVCVVGAGLSGLSAAWHLKRAGHEVRVYDKAGVAAGASGNSAGIMNPKLTAQRSAQSDWYAFAYDYSLRFLKEIGAPVTQCGSVHLQTDEEKQRKFAAYQNLGWHPDHMQFLDNPSDIAGVRIDMPGLFYPDAAVTSPRAICEILAQDIPVLGGKPEGDITVLANATGAADFCDIPVGQVRGQVSRVRANAANTTNLCYGGYFTPLQADGTHMCGATFQPWDEDPSVRAEDHARNIAQLQAAVPAIGSVEVAGGWTGFRAAAKDRHPIVGIQDGYILSVAHGSHGLVSGLAAGAVAAALAGGEAAPAGRDAITSLSPARFAK